MYISLRMASCVGTQYFLFLNCQWSLVLPHLLLGSFMNFVVELYGQQGLAMGVRSFKGKRGFGFVHGQAMNCQCLTKCSPNCPQEIVLELLVKVGPRHGCFCILPFSLMGYVFIITMLLAIYTVFLLANAFFSFLSVFCL